ncbi:MAG: glycoside hydrolase family 3 [Chloroflexota bacterium]|nr:glycoside hydrolase family 3 [Chloroflexota bacterium]
MSITERPQDTAFSPGEPIISKPFPVGEGMQIRPKRRLRFSYAVTLLILCGLIVLVGGDVQRNLFAQHVTPTVVVIPVTGPFVQAPMSPAQIDALRHIVLRIKYKTLAGVYVSRLTLDQKLGQLMMAEYSEGSYSADLQTMITKQYVGGVVTYALQMHTFDQTKHDITEMQKHAFLPLLISTDEEGGFVERVQNIYGHHPGALEIYQTGKVSLATAAGHRIAHDLQALGINEDLAPDVDVQLVDGPDQYLRTWGYTPQSVIKFGGAYLQAVQGDGVVACIKHFPGLGAASTDAHFNLPVVNRSSDQIYATELAPFKYFIQSPNKLENPGMIMPTDVLMPAIDPVWPAEISHTFITDILRKQLGYDGVVITDALYMKGISNKWNLGQAAVLALNAGDDMLLGANGSYQMQIMLDGIKQALANGTLSMARVNEAVTRIIALKIQYHLLPAVASDSLK